MRKAQVLVGMVVVVLSTAALADAAHRWGLKEGTPELKSAGQLAFGPEGVLFIGDAIGAQIVAVDTQDAKLAAEKPVRNIDRLDEKLSKLLNAKSVAVNDLAVNPLSGNIYLSVSIGEAQGPGIVRIDAQGELSRLSLEQIPFLKATLPNPPEDKVVGEGPRARNRRPEAITDLAYVDGKLLVSGMALEAGKLLSKIREYPFPFADREIGANIEIYHGNHGRLEDNAAVRTFIPMTIDGQPSLLAGFTCTPLVRFTLDSVQSGSTARGTTVAELGNRNTPLDMVAYKNGDYLLMSNDRRGVMKISTRDIGRSRGITEPVGGTAGQEFETIVELEGTVQFDRLDDDRIVVVLLRDGALTLKTAPLP
jgi:hypothetical protein